MTLINVRIYPDTELSDIVTGNGVIEKILPAGILSHIDDAEDMQGLFIVPGFINSHDHLDFNCFSPLGNRTYSDYKEWGAHIHKEYKKEIKFSIIELYPILI